MTGLLPIGTVVLLENSTKRVMIIGVLQKELNADEEKIWHYAGCFYPEGYMGPDKTFLFNTSQIAKIYALGYQDDDQFAFKTKVDKILEELSSKSLDEIKQEFQQQEDAK